MTALELCELAGLNPEAQQTAQAGLPVRAFVEQLVRAGDVRSALVALAQVLPKGDAIAWGLASIRGVETAMKKPGAADAAVSIEKWLAQPEDDLRYTVREAASRAGVGTPAGCLGMAVFYSGGSMAPSESPVSPEPAANICGKLVAGALALAIAIEPLRATERLRAFFDSGMRIANQGKIWEKVV